MTTATTNVKKLQKEIKAYDLTEIMYDVYRDRINFANNCHGIRAFFERRNIITNLDRAGFSIDLKDAICFGLPTSGQTFIILPDSRKKIIQVV